MPKNLMRKTLEGYFLDQTEVQCEPWKKVYDSLYYSPASEMEIRRQKIACLDAILDKDRERHADKMASLQNRWESAAQSMKAVDESVVRFDDHYKETNFQRDRYLRLAQRQDELKDLKVNDIKRLRKEKALMEEIRKQTSKRLDRFKPVEKYLEKVRDESQGEFRSIRDLLDRFTLLNTTRTGLMEREQQARSLVGQRTKQLSDLAVVKANEAVLLNNDIFEIREEYEVLRNRLERLDEDFLHIKTTAAERAMMLGQVRIASYNLYTQVCRRMNRPAKISSSDTIKQLQYIQNSMKEMSKLNRQVNLTLRKAHVEAEREKAERERLAVEKARKKFKDPRRKQRHDDFLGIFGFPQPEIIEYSDEDEK